MGSLSHSSIDYLFSIVRSTFSSYIKLIGVEHSWKYYILCSPINN
nr:MAG TPA: hypothetical protein [Crassvirales sp.]